MRPTRLEIQGLTAYRQPVDVDFSELDLFAITGDTGAGKSSLVDAISFALFGQAPRVGRNVRELISQGEDRLKVSLEFTSNGDRYRIHRETGRRGQKPPQIERFDKQRDEWLPEEPDRVRDANTFIEQILHMDYEAFIRSVLLPQGQFQEFLAGKPDERRKVLDRLLNLDVYKRMEVRANTMARDAEREAESIRQRLETELRDATPEALKAAKAELKALQQRTKDLASARDATEAACRAAEQLAETRKKHAAATAAHADVEKRLARAQEVLSGGQKTLDALDAQVVDVQAKIKATPYDADAHLRLSRCEPLLDAIDRAVQKEATLAKEVTPARPALKKAEATVETVTKQHQDAQVATQARHAEWEQARHVNAAALLRQGLKVGDPCPVCGDPIMKLPTAEKAAALDKLKAAWEKAQADGKRSAAALSGAEKALDRERTQLANLEQQLLDAKAERDGRLAELAAILPGETADRATVATRIKALETAKAQLEEATREEKRLLEQRQTTAAEIIAAKSDVKTLEIAVKTQADDAAAAAKQIAESETGLRRAAQEMDWPDVIAAMARGRDPAAVLHQHLTVVQNDEREALREGGRQETRIAEIERSIDTAKKLREDEKSHRKQGLLARDLGSLLRVDALPSFIRERALQTLAEDGSRRLEEISGGRYDFAVEGQDFLIVDKWNGGESRSVKTLSGGETFIASLALALSLAEHLPSLAGDGMAGALESLFIDEGFSHLDVETLDQVASALEVLGEDRRKLIGVITHVPALAERMPARITVHKSQTGSTVTVE